MPSENLKLEETIKQFQKAIKSLEDVLKQEKDEYMRDSAIQRFEYTFDLSWKAIKGYLEESRGVICKSPKGCLREAFQQNIVDYDDFWIQMSDLRNSTVHTYNEQAAESVYEKLPKALKYFKLLFKGLTTLGVRI